MVNSSSAPPGATAANCRREDNNLTRSRNSNSAGRGIYTYYIQARARYEKTSLRGRINTKWRLQVRRRRRETALPTTTRLLAGCRCPRPRKRGGTTKGFSGFQGSRGNSSRVQGVLPGGMTFRRVQGWVNGKNRARSNANYPDGGTRGDGLSRSREKDASSAAGAGAEKFGLYVGRDGCMKWVHIRRCGRWWLKMKSRSVVFSPIK